LQQHFGPDVVCDVVSVDGDSNELLPEERELVARAVWTRRSEFAAGRVCARRLIESLGFAPGPLLAATDRAPVWPDGLVGSIAHDALQCVVAVARAEHWAALGVDTEPNEPLEQDLWSSICTPSELEKLASQPREVRGTTARTLFSAKECVFKCVYPRTRAPLGFHDVEVELDLDRDGASGSFRARIASSHKRLAGAELSGFHFACGDSIVTGMALAPKSSVCAS
jgi:4'-phosphopantetheinyl transferase EntD